MVHVTEDLSLGKFSHCGNGWVEAVHGSGGNTTCDIRYVECAAGNCQHMEKGVPVHQLTEITNHFM